MAQLVNRFSLLLRSLIFLSKLRPGKSSFGVINDCGVGQSDFMWSVRANRQIKRIFARIWDTRDLLVSFDGCGVFRDWRFDPTWKTSAGWYHVDQNPMHKPELCSVQGFAALTDQNATTGGLVVYPRTHAQFSELCSIARQSGDFVAVPGDHPVMDHGRAVGLLIQCRAGDFVVWDSRLVHCNTPACVESERDPGDPVSLLRIVAYISMSPATFVRDQTLDRFRKKRKQMVQDNCTLNHWSPELRQASMFSRVSLHLESVCFCLATNRYLAKVLLSKLDAYQRGLIIGLDFDEE